jgi:IS605 OrfB family transposase
MLTIKEKIHFVSDEDTLKKCGYQSTGIFYKLYNNAELLEDKSFKTELINKSNLIDVSMFDFIVSDVKTKLSQKETNTNKKIIEYDNIIKSLNTNEISKKTRYKLLNKKSTLERTMNKDCCFGGKALLRNITKHAQLAQNIGNKLTQEEVIKNKELYEKELAEFRSKRKIGIYLVGRACEKGNRKIDFDLTNNKIIFKLNSKNNIEINLKSKRNKDYLSKIQHLIDTEQLPVTVRITDTHVCLSFDETIVSGYNFEETEYRRIIKKNNITTKEGKTEIAKQFHKKLEDKKLIGKIKNKFASVDLNPKEISLVIGNKLSDNKEGDFKVIFKHVFSLEKLCDKTGLSSDDDKQKSYNQKRKHEIKEIWKQIFIICLHYKVYNFVTEELNLKTNHKKDNNKEFNRQTKNIWHRELSNKLIEKWINIYGLKHIEINPCYSSFIGNLIHNEYDPIAAAIEIMRRGMVKYIKGNSLYPDLQKINQQKLNYLVGENICSQNWQQLYKQIICAGLRYRNRDKEIYFREGNYLNSYKSKVEVLRCL